MKANVAQALMVVAKGWNAVEITAIRSEAGEITGYDGATGAVLTYPLTTTRIPGAFYSHRTAPLLIPTVGRYVVSLREPTTADTQEQVIKVTDGAGSEDELSEDELARIRMYLGYPASTRFPDWQLEGALSQVQGDAAAITLIRELLAQMTTLDGQMIELGKTLRVSEADGVKLAGEKGLRAQRGEGRRMAERLARILAVECRGAAFGASGISSGYL